MSQAEYPHSCCLCDERCDCPYSYTGCMGCSACEKESRDEEKSVAEEEAETP